MPVSRLTWPPSSLRPSRPPTGRRGTSTGFCSFEGGAGPQRLGVDSAALCGGSWVVFCHRSPSFVGQNLRSRIELLWSNHFGRRLMTRAGFVFVCVTSSGLGVGIGGSGFHTPERRIGVAG